MIVDKNKTGGEIVLYYSPYPDPYYVHYYHTFPLQSNQHPSVYRPKQAYPPVDTGVFYESAVAFQTLMREASKIINRIATSNTFAHQLMTAAQQSDQTKVDQLIASTGVTRKVKTTFNPDSLRIILTADVKNTECCELAMILRWR